jgi:Polyketide cyclase / dehydrase and lipid transport
MRRISVSSTVIINARPEDVWPLLCNFKLPKNPKWYLKSLPFPQECKIIGKNGIGAHRKCKTTKCHINQKITEWTPPNRLAFVVVSDNGGILKRVKRLEYILVLEWTGQSTSMTCRTNLDVNMNPILGYVKIPFLSFIMKKLQKFTIDGIKVLAETQPPVINSMI